MRGGWFYELALRIWGREDERPHSTLSFSLSLASFRRYELSEDTLAQICESDYKISEFDVTPVDAEGRWRRDGATKEMIQRERGKGSG